MNIVPWRNLGASWHLLGNKETHELVQKLVSPSRGDFLSPFSPPRKNRPVLNFDSAIRSPVPQRDEEKRCKGEDRPPLTSVPLHLLQQRTPCQTEGWAELHPSATRAAPGSFGFDDTETSIEHKHTHLRWWKMSQNHHKFAFISVSFGLCLSALCADCSYDSVVKRVSWEMGKTKPDTGTMLIIPQQSAPVHKNTWESGLSWTWAVHTFIQ